MKKTDEEQGGYDIEAEVAEAVTMLGTGYEPSVEIEAPREVVERRDGKLVEAKRPAFVKIYTSFKDEMRDIDEIALKVWLYIALSVNRDTGEAHPGLRTIAEGVKLAVNTVRAAVERLEAKNLLTVDRKGRKYNRYYPTDYISARRETVSPGDTDGKTVSAKPETVSARVILNQRNQINQQPEERPNVFEIYQQEIGILTPMIADALEDLEKSVPANYIPDAIREAVTNNARNWKYVEAILKRWKAQGHQGKQVKAQSKNGKPKQPNGFSVIQDWLEKTTGEVVNGNS